MAGGLVLAKQLRELVVEAFVVRLTVIGDPGASLRTSATGYGREFLAIAAILIVVAATASALPARRPR